MNPEHEESNCYSTTRKEVIRVVEEQGWVTKCGPHGCPNNYECFNRPSVHHIERRSDKKKGKAFHDLIHCKGNLYPVCRPIHDKIERMIDHGIHGDLEPHRRPKSEKRYKRQRFQKSIRNQERHKHRNEKKRQGRI